MLLVSRLAPRLSPHVARETQRRSFACQPAELFSAAAPRARPLKYAIREKQRRRNWLKWYRATQHEAKRIAEPAALESQQQKDRDTTGGNVVTTPSWEDLPTHDKTHQRKFALHLRTSGTIPIKLGNVQRITRRFSRFGPVLDVLIPPKKPYCCVVFFANNEALQYALGRKDEMKSEEWYSKLLFRPPPDWRILEVERAQCTLTNEVLNMLSQP